MRRFMTRVLMLSALTAGAGGLAACGMTAFPARSTTPSARDSKKIYEHYCSGCHAAQGTGDSFRGVPALAGQRYPYLRRQIEMFSGNSRRNSEMHWAFTQVSMNQPQAAAEIALYISQLPPPKFGAADRRFHSEGEAAFMARCTECHGMDAHGNADGTIPSLRAQNDLYLVNRLRRFAAADTAVDVGAHAMNEHDAIAISAYLSSLGGWSKIGE